ncbi:hypothetical protein [Dipodfec virus RodF1_85]|uniref:Uncharacterized protein n=1 Tax=Dipodfec virus RodF1_85 TaxID=2929314 RepID=A0A976R7V8_9VIRU|nr:hypothetical protein [Dipodfec virus RodF1_85]
MDTDIDFGQWAAGLYSREQRGEIYEAEEQDGVPLEIPLGFRTPETLEQQISRLVRAYQADTGNEVETIDEANDFSLLGEDEDYEEDDYIVDSMEQQVMETLPRPVSEKQDEAAPTPAEPEASPADNAGS